MTVYSYKKHFISDDSYGNSKSTSRIVFVSMGVLSAALLCLSVFSMTSDTVAAQITKKNNVKVDFTPDGDNNNNDHKGNEMSLFRMEDEKTTEVFNFGDDPSIQRSRYVVEDNDRVEVDQGDCEYLPRIYDSSVGILKRVGREMMLHHRWLSPIVHYSERYSRLHRFGPLAVEAICFCFFNAAVYTYTDPDDGSCSASINERDCITKNHHKCFWVKSTHDCYFSQPEVTLNEMVLVIVVSAVASAIISRLVEGIVLKIVVYQKKSQTKRPDIHKNSVIKAHQRSGEIENGNILESAGELFRPLHTHRSRFTGRHGSIQPISRPMTPSLLRQQFNFRIGEKPVGQTANNGDAIGMRYRSYIFQLPLEADVDNLQAGLRQVFFGLDEDAAQRFSGSLDILIEITT